MHFCQLGLGMEYEMKHQYKIFVFQLYWSNNFVWPWDHRIGDVAILQLAASIQLPKGGQVCHILLQNRKKKEERMIRNKINTTKKLNIKLEKQLLFHKILSLSLSLPFLNS